MNNGMTQSNFFTFASRSTNSFFKPYTISLRFSRLMLKLTQFNYQVFRICMVEAIRDLANPTHILIVFYLFTFSPPALTYCVVTLLSITPSLDTVFIYIHKGIISIIIIAPQATKPTLALKCSANNPA